MSTIVSIHKRAPQPPLYYPSSSPTVTQTDVTFKPSVAAFNSQFIGREQHVVGALDDKGKPAKFRFCIKLQHYSGSSDGSGMFLSAVPKGILLTF